MMPLIKLKIGRHEYDITDQDLFMDNGFCIQLMSQSKEKLCGITRPNPVLPKRAVKELAKYQRIEKTHNYGISVVVFSIKKTQK